MSTWAQHEEHLRGLTRRERTRLRNENKKLRRERRKLPMAEKIAMREARDLGGFSPVPAVTPGVMPRQDRVVPPGSG
jgi:hypothetical protein